MSKLLERVTRDSNAEIDALTARVGELESRFEALLGAIQTVSGVLQLRLDMNDRFERLSAELLGNVGVLQDRINNTGISLSLGLGRTQNAVKSALEDIAPRKVVNEFTENIKQESVK